MRHPDNSNLRDDVLSAVTAQDADRILDLNNEHAVETSSLDLSAAEHLLAMCSSEERGLRYQAYLKMLIHQALREEGTRASR